MDASWKDETTEKSQTDMETVMIDKWNQSVDKYKDSLFMSNSNEMYDYGNTTLISDRTRVYKGGSWKDRLLDYPGTRRFLDQSQSSDCIGFRCANMDRVGPSKSDLKSNQRKELTIVNRKVSN